MIKITARQKQVLELMKRGKGRKLIARELLIDPLTVYCHQNALVNKGIISRGTAMTRRTILKDGRSYRVSA